MTTRDTPFAPGTPCWVDLRSSDLAASTEFYGGLFGWEASEGDEEFGGYVTFSSDGHQVAGMMPAMAGSEDQDGWTTYISTADIAVTVAAVDDAGGKVVMSPMQVGDLGSMAIALDPTGGSFGIWQPARHIGFEKYNEPNTVTWDEVHSPDFAVTTEFFEKIFRWAIVKTSDTDQFRYYEGQIDGQTVVGLMDAHAMLPAGATSRWDVYIAVADVDAGASKASELGGEVTQAPEDTPYGRIAQLTDATGAALKLHGPTLADRS